MLPRFDIQELATAMYNSTDHSDIRSDWSGYDYEIPVKPDGTIGHGENSEWFSVSFNFSGSFWDGIDRESVLGGQSGWDPIDWDETIDDLLGRADDQESLCNPGFAACVESMYSEIAEWLDGIEEEDQ